MDNIIQTCLIQVYIVPIKHTNRIFLVFFVASWEKKSANKQSTINS